MKKRLLNWALVALIGLAAPAVVMLVSHTPEAQAGEQARSIVGNGYGVILDDRDRCVFAFSDAALPTNVASFCQNGSLLYRTDSSTMQVKSSGSFGTWNPVISLDRSSLVEDALQPYPIPLYSLRAADMAALGVSETAGDHYIVVSTNDIILRGEISDDETEASVSYFQAALPPSYVAGGDVTLTANSKTAVVGAGGATNGSTIDFQCYEINQTTGAAGSDIVATAAQAIDGTAAADVFTITATDLVAGDILNCRMTTSVIENDSSTGTIQAEIYSIILKADIKG